MSWHRSLPCIGLVSAIALLAAPAACRAESEAQQVEAILHAYHEIGQFQGSTLVARDGQIIFRAGYGEANIEWGVPNTPETKHRIASHGKSFTAVITLQLVQDGLLDLNEPIATYLPQYRRDNGDRVTIHHLLSHTSGAPRVVPEWEDTNYRNPYTLDRIVALANQLDLESEPGARFNYSNLGYNLLGAIIENVTGKPYAEVLHDRILDPLGMRNTGLTRHAPILANRAAGSNRLMWGEFVNAPYQDESFAVGAGGMYSTVDDMLKWQEGLFGDALLTEQSKMLMFTRGKGDSGYGCGVATYVKGDGTRNKLVYWMGGTSGAASVTFRLVEDRVSIILLGNMRQIPQGEVASNITNALVDISINPIRASAIEPLYHRLMAEESTAVLSDYRAELEAEQPGVPSEGDLNRLGYDLLGVGRTTDAMTVFRFNVAAYPDSWNVFDSLAEACEADEQTDQAIENYRRSLDLNPDNTHARQRLTRLTIP